MADNNEFVVPCPICGSGDQKTQYNDTLEGYLPQFDYAFSPKGMRTYRIVQCKNCSHAFSIVPNNDLWKNYQSVIDQEYLNHQEVHELTAKKVIRILIKYIPSGKLLNSGCATGDFLSVAQKKYKVEGLERAQWSSEITEKRGFKIHTYKISEMPSDSKFDIVTLWGVIAYFDSPKTEVENIYRILKHGGFVCIWTGDIDSWLARLLGKKWWYILGQHTQFFSRKSLNKLFLNNGFQNITVTKYPFTTKLNLLNKSLYRYKWLRPISKYILESKVMGNKTVTLKLPCEMLAIYKKDPSK